MTGRRLTRKINAIYRWYPPRRWLFFPLYRFLRRKTRWSMSLCSLMVWCISALLHAGAMAAFGSVVAAVVWGAVFLILGVISSAVILVVKRPHTTLRTART